jgi:hypothetical protein
MNSYKKWGLKNHPDKIFITENLTKYRTGLVKQLVELKYNGLLYTYWTSDGRIFIKQNTTSRKLLINNNDDILDFIHSTEHDTLRNIKIIPYFLGAWRQTINYL